MIHQVHSLHRGAAVPFEEALAKLTGLSGEEVRLMIAMGGAYLGKQRWKEPRTQVRKGTKISAYFRLPLRMEPVAFEPRWVMVDDGQLLVANKPNGLPTQGRRDADYMAFYELLKQHVRGYLGLHHRLDQGTSGLMVFTRNPSLNKNLSALFQERLVTKTYLAIAFGHWQGPDLERIVDAPIAPQRQRQGTRQVIAAHGKPAQTKLRLLNQHDDYCLVEARPLTGRTHQIRVHLAHVGLPLLGDSFYGGPGDSGFFLHCAGLAWPGRGRLAKGDYHAPVPEAWHRLSPDLFPSDWSTAPC